MTDYKQFASQHAAEYIKPGQIIGVGSGNSVLYLLDALHKKEELSKSLRFITPCVKTYERLQLYKMKIENSANLSQVDWYFDGCDQVDEQLNAFKSGGGIHSAEKFMASMAAQFVILADTGKFVSRLDHTFPLCVEVIPGALSVIIHRIEKIFADAKISVRASVATGEPTFTVGGNRLIDVRFSVLPGLSVLNSVKMMPGVIDHSLFFELATSAFVAGPDGVKEYHRPIS